METKKINNEEELVQYLIDNNILCVITNDNMQPRELRKIFYEDTDYCNFSLMGSIGNLLTFRPRKFVYTNPKQSNLKIINKTVFISNKLRRMDRVKGTLYFTTNNHYLLTDSYGADILAKSDTNIEYDYTEENFDIIDKI